jgi:hypothetical protein
MAAGAGAGGGAHAEDHDQSGHADDTFPAGAPGPEISDEDIPF